MISIFILYYILYSKLINTKLSLGYQIIKLDNLYPEREYNVSFFGLNNREKYSFSFVTPMKFVANIHILVGDDKDIKAHKRSFKYVNSYYISLPVNTKKVVNDISNGYVLPTSYELACTNNKTIPCNFHIIKIGYVAIIRGDILYEYFTNHNIVYIFYLL